MWIRLQKELRELALPAGAVTGIALLVVPWGRAHALWVFGLLCFYLTVRPLGLEFDRGTLASLLAQPISRSRIWWEKILAAAIAVFLGLGIVIPAVWVRGLESGPFPLWPGVLLSMVQPLVAITTGPAFSLLLRNTLRSFWVALTLPMGILLVLAVVDWALPIEISWLQVQLVLLLCYAVMAVWGYLRFRTFQIDTGRRRQRPRPWTDAPSPPPRAWHPSPWGAARELFLKELRLQHSSLLLVPVAVAGWLLAWLLSFHAASDSTLNDVLKVTGFLPSAFLLLVVPALIGAHAVASERQLGVLEWKLGLPLSRRFQWLLKLACCVSLTLLVSSFLGTALTWILAQRLATEPPALPLVQLAVIPLVPLASAIWASKLARSPFNALGLSLILGIGVLWVWGLLRFTTSLLDPGGVRVVDLWGVFSFTSSRFLSSGGMLLVNMVIGATLLAVILAPRHLEDWLVGRRVYRSAGIAAFGAMALVAFGVQIYLLHRISAELDREIAAQDAKLLRVDGARDGLRPELDFNQWCTRLTPIYYYMAPILDRDRSAERHVWEPLSDTTKRAVLLDDPLGGLYYRHRRCAWTWWIANKEWYRPPEWPRVPLWRACSIAPVWFREHRLQQLDRRLRQYVAFDFPRSLDYLERSPSADPETVRRLAEQLRE